MARKPKTKPGPEPSPEEKRLDEQIAKEQEVKKRSREVHFAWVRLHLRAERCAWRFQNFELYPPYGSCQRF